MISQNSFRSPPPADNFAEDEIDDELEEEEETVKVLVLGSSQVGKSSLISSFVYPNNYRFQSEHYPTIEDRFTMTKDIKGRSVKLEIVEVGGDEAYEPVIHHHIASADAFLLMYSATDRRSFEYITEVVDEIRTIKKKVLFPACVVANKSELKSKQVVAKSEAQNLSEQLQAPAIPCSTKNKSDAQVIISSLLNKCFSFNTQQFLGAIVKTDRRKSRYGAKKSTKYRAFALQGQDLKWSKAGQKKDKQLGRIHLTSIVNIEDVGESSFKLVMNDESVVIQAKTVDMKKDWVHRMRIAMAQSV